MTSGVPIELSIIIVSYNTREFTLAALESLYAHPPPVPFEVILLDNASSDGSYEAIVAAYPQVNAIDNRDNVGFAAGNNIAAEQARGRRILLLNPDTIVLESSFPALWAFAEREPGRGIWGGRTLFADGALNPTSCWRKISLWSLFCSAVGLTRLFPNSGVFNPEAYGGWRRDSAADVDIVTGCFLLIDADLWRQLGGFDPTFFMYAEEADLCLRAATLGARPGITPEAQLVHYGGKSEVSQTEKVIKVARGRATLMRKHWSAPAFAAARGLLLFWAGARVIGSLIVPGPNDDPSSSKQKWREIWRRRREWINGYANQPAGK